MCTCCIKRTKILPQIEDIHGEYMKLSDNKTIYLLHYNNTQDSNHETLKIKSDDNKKVENELKFDTPSTILEISTNSEPFIEVGIGIDNNFFQVNTPNNDNDKFLHLGVYKKCLNYIKNPGLIAKYYKSENEKFGYTVIYRKRLKNLKNNTTSTVNPTIFFIHGVGGSTNIWNKQIAYFVAKGYEIIIPDLPGHGKSTKELNENSFQFTSLAQDMLQIFDKYKRSKNVIIGHSYGYNYNSFLFFFF